MAAPHRVSFKLTILALFLVLTTGVSALVLGVSYRRNSEATVQAADRLLEHAAGRIVAATDHLIEPLYAITNAATLIPGVGNLPGPRGDYALSPMLYEVLERYPQMNSAYVGNAQGDFYRIVSLNSLRTGVREFLRAPTQAAFAVQTVHSERGRRVERWRFLDAAQHEVGSITDPEETYDPRTRLWYAAAQISKKPIVTDFYVFASAPSFGVTVAQAVGDGNGTVFAIDLTLTSISRYLATVRVSQLAAARHAEIALFKSDGRLLAHSDNAAYERTLNTFDEPRILNVSEMGGGVMEMVAARVGSGASPQGHVVAKDGTEWLVHVARLGPTFGEGTHLALAVPMEDVLGSLADSARQTLLISLLCAFAVLPFVYLAAGAVSAPLRRLTGEIEGMKDLDLATRPTVRSTIAEIQDLAAALASAKVMLGAFGKYVPKNLARQIIGSGMEPRLGGERRPITVLFSDVRDFTTMSEQLPPERLMALTSEYLEGFVRVIHGNRGTVDKFVGDMVVAFWNAPTPNPAHAADACRAVLACRDWSNDHNEQWAREGKPVFYTRFGVHLGDAVVGNVGSSDRMDYTVIGASINVGSRTEGLNKEYGTQVLITSSVVEAAGPGFAQRPVDRVLPKGALHPLDLFELLGVYPGVDARTAALCTEWGRFYESYRRRDWQSAGELLARFVAQFGEDKLARIYAERIGRFKLDPPPADWDGVIRYATK